MAFSAFTSAAIQAGKAVKQELWTKVKDNFDDHETRITNAEAAADTVAPLRFEVIGEGGVLDGASYSVVLKNLTINGIKVFSKEAGTSGTLEVDVLRSDDSGSTWNTLLSTPIQVPYTNGDFDITSGTLAISSLSINDIVRLDINSVQTDMQGFIVIIENEVTA